MISAPISRPAPADEFGANLDIGPSSRRPQGSVRVIDTLAAVLLQDDLPAEARRDLAEFLLTGEGRNLETFRDDAIFRTEKTRAVLGLILGLPEYHS